MVSKSPKFTVGIVGVCKIIEIYLVSFGAKLV